jgi:hypothetical protein
VLPAPSLPSRLSPVPEDHAASARPVADPTPVAKASPAPIRTPAVTADITPPPPPRALTAPTLPRAEPQAEHTLKIGTIEIRVTPPPAPPPKAAPAARPSALSRGLSSSFGLRQG